MFRVIRAVSDDVLSHKLIVQLKLLKSLHLLSQMPLIFFYMFLFTLYHIRNRMVLLLDRNQVLVQIKARLNCRSSILPYLRELSEWVRKLMSPFVGTLWPFLLYVGWTLRNGTRLCITRSSLLLVDYILITVIWLVNRISTSCDLLLCGTSHTLHLLFNCIHLLGVVVRINNFSFTLLHPLGRQSWWILLLHLLQLGNFLLISPLCIQIDQHITRNWPQFTTRSSSLCSVE